MKDILSRSDNISREYCCSVVKLGEVIPVEGSDFLGKTIVDGFQIVVRKDMVKEGDIMFYASNETELNQRFLSVNNQFDQGNLEKNANYSEVVTLQNLKSKLENEIQNEQNSDVLDQIKIDVKKEQIKQIDDKLASMRGFFNKYGRVKMITLRKCPSLGYLFSIDAMAKFCPKIKNIDFEALLNNPDSDLDFDTVDGELFVKAYVPRSFNKEHVRLSKSEKRQKKVERFDRIIDNQFVFHYDTQQLNKNIHRINPDDVVYISTKLHGTSFICANIKVKNIRKYSGLFGKFRTYINEKVLPNKLKRFDIGYDYVYSSRTVIKNQYINTKVGGGYYKSDIWGEYQKHLLGKIPEGMTIYGEIVGYLTDSDTMIQKNYDYGNERGHNTLMIYRITTDEGDKKKEWEIDDVIEFSKKLQEDEELSKFITPYPLMYKGTLRNLYPDIEINDSWNDNVLEALKNEKRFGMEKKEPLCKNSVPREGFVLRIANDELKEAFKLKCSKFLEMEGKLIDSGEVDMETSMRYDS